MKIICKRKDYYDYLSGIYGIDNEIVYDRRICNHFKQAEKGIDYFIKNKLNNDSEGKILKLYFILEIGYVHYLFLVERELKNNEIELTPKILDKKEIEKKISTSPLSLIPVRNTCDLEELDSLFYKICIKSYLSEIPNPILLNTWVPAFIPAEEIYNTIYNYLISIKEPKIEDKRTDVQKLESKGFDKKISFRNIK